MHCLGAGTTGGQVSPGGFGNRGSILNVVQAFGVLVCEGRIQGAPRGYKEGPHCVPALQSTLNDHVCDKDNYLCDRYLVLVREITERVAIGSYLCVEVVLCSDCPCGLIKSKSKHRVLSSAPLTSWQHSSEMLLEYWCIGIVPSKGPETMNSQGLYQAVRSRLHFSQVAAWWSRTNGTRPSYVATRIVQHTGADDHLRRFRDTPVEHTFPLASLGDGNSLKVTMWALPRMEDIPCLQCTLHPPQLEEANDGLARPPLPAKLLIPLDGTASPSSSGLGDGKSTKGPVPPPPCAAPTDSFVYYMSSFRSAELLDDRLQIACDKPGKHHCHCADEEDEVEVVPAGPVLGLPRPVSERKRRRSLPCGPPDPGLPTAPEQPVLPALREVAPVSDATLDGLARRFRAQLSIDERQEKRYKRATAPSDDATHVPLVTPWIPYGPEAGGKPSVNLVLNPLYESEGEKVKKVTAITPKSKTSAAPTSPATTSTVTTSPTSTITSGGTGGPPDLDRLVSKLSFVQEREARESNGPANLNWISPPTPAKCELRSRNCSLELSPREFDEVLAVLRARTPLGKRRTAKRREKLTEAQQQQQHHQHHQQHQQHQYQQHQAQPKPKDSSKADVLLGAILRTTEKEQPEVTNPRVSESECPNSGSGINRRLSRLKQLFKQRQQSPQRDPRAKRRIDFVAGRPTVVDSVLEDEAEDEAEDEENGENEAAHLNAALGTSVKPARANTISPSTNGEKRLGSRLLEHRRLEERTSKKSRCRRELSPIWLNQINNGGDGDGIGVQEAVKETNGELNAEEVDCGDTIDRTVVPTAKDQERFRRSLENATSMVFHSRTGLPLTSSPAPLRRGSCCFDFDSSLNSVSSKRSALFELSTPPSPGAVSLEEGDRETESACDTEEVTRGRSTSRSRPQSHALLGSFEESALNGRLEPVSTVHGFTAEIGASGSFCPKHRKLPVTVFFYTLGDNDKVSSPYLAHINLGKKGYQVPRMGTIQVTLLNPLGTVVKMFVVLYDLTDMPERSHTFLRQRTLRDKMLRYLIHLRFMSNKSGRIYLHTDVRMIICRKSDMDTASDFGSEPPKELRSYIHGPTNPKFSPRC